MKIQELIAWIEQRAPGTYFPFCRRFRLPGLYFRSKSVQQAPEEDQDEKALQKVSKLVPQGLRGLRRRSRARYYFSDKSTLSWRTNQAEPNCAFIRPVGSVPFFHRD
ncbi:hypothetical protein P7H12_10615 [Paenibacillus larvae]|nr:hypothetical protein [Paenibacillus larvae]MDT2263956.1 hypothetical protein [Paenibacillus larvae]